MTPDGTGSLAVVVPSRGRPGAIVELARAFAVTCDEYTPMLVVIDEDDPAAEDYRQAVGDLETWGSLTTLISQPSGTMVSALNAGAAHVLATRPNVEAIGFLGDDHRPQTPGWDTAYIEALRTLPGFVYGNDRVQGVRLPTQIAVSARVVAALGHMAPPTLRHLYVDNYWLTLGRIAGCISYLPNILVEHVHPVTGKVAWDEGHLRVNQPAMYTQDHDALEAYMAANLNREVLAVVGAAARATR